MAPESFVLDPALEELLREVAADPDSCLLRVPRPKALPALFDNDPRVSDRMAGLNLAERELLRVHRAELAELLLEVCRYKLIEGPRSRLFVYKYRADGETASPLDPDEASARAEARHVELDAASDLDALALLHACIGEPIGDRPSVAAIAAAAARLRPSIAARGLAAQFYAQGAAPRSALRSLGSLLERALSRSQKATAWSTIGCAYSRAQSYLRAHGAYASACELEPQYVPAWIGRLLLACQAGCDRDAVFAGREVGALFDSHAREIRHLCAVNTDGRRVGAWHPSRDAAATADLVYERCAGVAREVVDALR